VRKLSNKSFLELINKYDILSLNECWVKCPTDFDLPSYEKQVFISREVQWRSIGTRFVNPSFLKFFNSSLLREVFIINSVEQLQTLPKTQSEIDISPFLKTQKPSSTLGCVYVTVDLEQTVIKLHLTIKMVVVLLTICYIHMIECLMRSNHFIFDHLTLFHVTHL
jgi:hypothetical protein